jgi:hypothetical protein
MPLTAFQRTVARLLAGNRNPESHLAGGAVINRADASLRFSDDLDQANRHTRFQESDLKGEHLTRPVDLRELKKQWLTAYERAERLFERLPAEDLGCLYLSPANTPVTPEAGSADFPKLKRHFGSVRGAWPKIS